MAQPTPTARLVAGYAVDLKLVNFWDTEPEFTWSSGRWCEIIFDVTDFSSLTARGEIFLDLDVFRVENELKKQDVFFYLNGLRTLVRSISERAVIIIPFEKSTLRRLGNVLACDTPDAASPSQFAGSDARILGLKLYSFSLHPTP